MTALKILVVLVVCVFVVIGGITVTTKFLCERANPEAMKCFITYKVVPT